MIYGIVDARDRLQEYIQQDGTQALGSHQLVVIYETHPVVHQTNIRLLVPSRQ